MAKIDVDCIQCSYKLHRFQIKEIVNLFNLLKTQHFVFSDHCCDLNAILINTITFHTERQFNNGLTLYDLNLDDYLPTDLVHYFRFQINRLIERLLDMIDYLLKSSSITEYFIERNALYVKTIHYNYLKDANNDF